ncbi:MAG: ATP-binding protein, partial [Nanoarchaeota archaeon]
MMNLMNVEEVLKKLKPIIGEKADELWYTWLASDFQERKELEIDIGIIAEKALREGPLAEREILLPPPDEKQAAGDFILGHVVYRGKKLFPVGLREQDFIRQIGIFSITGGGKSNVAMLLCLELLRRGKTPWMVIDWKRQYRSMLSLKGFPNMEKVEIYTIGRDVLPFLWNPFRPPPGTDFKAWLAVIVECLEKSHLAGLGVWDIITNIFTKLHELVKDDTFYPNFYDGMRELQKMKVGGREFLWWQSTKRIFSSFLGAGSKSFNARNPLKLEELLGKPVILELDESLPKPLRIFIMEVILKFIFLYRLSRGDSDELLHVTFLEEIHNLTRATKYDDGRIDSLENVARQIRSTGEGLVYIDQHISTLPVFLTGNVHTLALLAQQHEDDVMASRKALFMPRDDEVYLNMLKTGSGIVKVLERINPCLVQFLFVPVQKGVITDEWLRLHRQGISRANSDDISHENRGYFRGEREKPEIPEIGEIPSAESPARKLLVDILQHPLSGVTERYRRLHFNAREGNQGRKLLVAEGLIQPKAITTQAGWITLFEMKPKGRMLLRDIGYKVKDELTEGVEHKFWKEELARHYSSQGYDVEVEKERNGKADVVASRLGKRIAVEIEGGESDFLGNIER